MKEIHFEWDENKAKVNFGKHKISFEEAKTVFDDVFLLTFPVLTHSEAEQRYINIGLSSQGRILIVIHTERETNIRLISSRKAAKFEQRDYEEGNF